ncbi:MAG TPA: hypothetical protein VNN79_05020 [Actinomycetota bacterium]|nr:hypothetical protein [Actinomycetota bacterium]
MGRREFLGGDWTEPFAPTGTAIVLRGLLPNGTSIATNAGAVLVARGDRFRRLLALPAPTTLSGTPGALVIGDSVMLDARSALANALRGWRVEVDAQVGDTTFVGERVAAGQRGRTGEVVIVELGTNESDVEGFTERATQMLHDLSGAGLVVWLTVHSPRSYAPAINDAIGRVVADAPNAVIADWDRVAPPKGFIGDGVHLNERGIQAMVRLLAPLAKRWRSAAEGGGSIACRDRALALAAG